MKGRVAHTTRGCPIQSRTLRLGGVAMLPISPHSLRRVPRPGSLRSFSHENVSSYKASLPGLIILFPADCSFAPPMPANRRFWSLHRARCSGSSTALVLAQKAAKLGITPPIHLAYYGGPPIGPAPSPRQIWPPDASLQSIGNPTTSTLTRSLTAT